MQSNQVATKIIQKILTHLEGLIGSILEDANHSIDDRPIVFTRDILTKQRVKIEETKYRNLVL
jgi:hypothetical protein